MDQRCLDRGGRIVARVVIDYIGAVYGHKHESYIVVSDLRHTYGMSDSFIQHIDLIRTENDDATSVVRSS